MTITPEELAIIRTTKFTIQVDDENRPTCITITIPIDRCARDIEEGAGLMSGMIDEAKKICVRKMRDLRNRIRVMKPGVIGPDGKPMGGFDVN